MSLEGQARAEYQRQWWADWRDHFARTGEVPSHGLTGYRIGCRCHTCRAAEAEVERPHQERRRAKQRAARDPNAGWDEP